MNYYLLIWNPNRWPWKTLSKDISEIQSGSRVEREWSVGNTKSIVTGDKVILMRLGEEPKGVMGSGTVVEERHDKPHWDESRNERIGYITINFDILLEPRENNIVSLSYLKDHFPDTYWTAQRSGIRIPSDVGDNVIRELKKVQSEN